MKPDNEYSAQRYCKSCKAQTNMYIRLEEWKVFLTCHSCNASYELERYRLRDFPLAIPSGKPE
jgi:hypothetical protein